MNQTTNAKSTGMIGFRLGSELTGTTVHNREFESIGSINDLIVDAEKGNIRFAVVGVGGFLGMGETDVMVPWGAFRWQPNTDTNEEVFVLDVTREQLEKAPRFDRDKLDQFYTREMSEPVFRHYRVTYIA